MIDESAIRTTTSYSIDETAKLLNISRKTVYNIMNEGLLIFKYSQRNGRRIIPGKEILRFLKQNYI